MYLACYKPIKATPSTDEILVFNAVTDADNADCCALFVSNCAMASCKLFAVTFPEGTKEIDDALDPACTKYPGIY